MTSAATRTTTPEFEIHLAEQVRLTTEIMYMMVGIEVSASTATWPPEEMIVASIVRFDGAWRGAVMFESTSPLAFEFTARFMGISLPTEVNDDVCDSLGELANMIAGNFKSLLPSGTHLCLPKVHTESAATHLRPAGQVLCETVFQTSFGDCCVKLEDQSA